jgi:hypothetical protein
LLTLQHITLSKGLVTQLFTGAVHAAIAGGAPKKAATASPKKWTNQAAYRTNYTTH